MTTIKFDVIDNQTGSYPDCEKIALTEEWAKRLVYCDIDGFAIMEDGTLILTDDCGNIAYPPSDRFTVNVDPDSLRPKGRWIFKHNPITDPKGYFIRIVCSECNLHTGQKSNFCPNCGADMREEKT